MELPFLNSFPLSLNYLINSINIGIFFFAHSCRHLKYPPSSLIISGPLQDSFGFLGFLLSLDVVIHSETLVIHFQISKPRVEISHVDFVNCQAHL